jgi:ketosteroid isomerase-like protein
MKAHKWAIGFVSILCSLFIFCTCNAQKTTKLEEARKAIAAINAIYHQSWAKNDSSIFINSYAEDACIMAPNAAMYCGRAEIARFFRESYNAGLRGGNFKTLDVYGDGVEYVTEVNLGQITDINGKLLDEGKSLVLWKKTKQGWKMFRDCFNSSTAAK